MYLSERAAVLVDMVVIGRDLKQDFSNIMLLWLSDFTFFRFLAFFFLNECDLHLRGHEFAEADYGA